MYSEEDFKYIRGEKFSAGLKVDFPGEYFKSGRLKLIENIVSNKAVLHIGCADHPPLIQKKVEENNWLHANLERVSKKIVGVDISEKGIDEARKYTKSLLYKANVAEQWSSDLSSHSFDIAVLGEIIEHVDDPVSFLKQIKKNSNGSVKKLLITAPNAWSFLNIRSLLRGKEYINTDHRFWFTPFTLAKVLDRAGWKASRCWYTEPFYSKNPIIHCSRKLFPYMSETIVIEAICSD